MMEGISSEAFSLAGTLKLSKLIIFYDSNRISNEGSTDIAFRENVQERMQAFGFQTITVEDGNDIDAIGKALASDLTSAVLGDIACDLGVTVLFAAAIAAVGLALSRAKSRA